MTNINFKSVIQQGPQGSDALLKELALLRKEIDFLHRENEEKDLLLNQLYNQPNVFRWDWWAEDSLDCVSDGFFESLGYLRTDFESIRQAREQLIPTIDLLPAAQHMQVCFDQDIP
ncbi:MAG: hypothetical protein HKN32_03470, partial [Flavobacteriales bacterium]|nr:hypothetical protein [Flavobacteriales bacterium]